jgi:hypothetical protein
MTEILPQESVYQYPQFPRHGLPRIVITLSLLVIPAVAIALWVLVIYSLNQNSPRITSTAASSSTFPVPYRALPEYVKNGRPLKNILIRPKLERDALIQLAKYLHSSSPQTNFRIFDDDTQYSVI